MSVLLVEAVLHHAEAVPHLARLIVAAAANRYPQGDPMFDSLFDQALVAAHNALGMAPPLPVGEHIVF